MSPISGDSLSNEPYTVYSCADRGLSAHDTPFFHVQGALHKINDIALNVVWEVRCYASFHFKNINGQVILMRCIRVKRRDSRGNLVF